MNPETKLGTNVPKTDALAGIASSPVLARIPPNTQSSLLRMFADPYLLEKEERGELVQGLRECVLAHPEVSELRVLYGMALCVNFNVQEAIEELREGVRLAPDSFIAQLKMGELWMRLRVMRKGGRTHPPGRAAGPERDAVGNGAPASGGDPNHVAQRNQARGLQLQGTVALGNGSAQTLEARAGGKRCPGFRRYRVAARPAPSPPGR